MQEGKELAGGPVSEEAYYSANTSLRLGNEVMQQIYTCTGACVFLIVCIIYLLKKNIAHAHIIQSSPAT